MAEPICLTGSARAPYVDVCRESHPEGQGAPKGKRQSSGTQEKLASVWVNLEVHPPASHVTSVCPWVLSHCRGVLIPFSRKTTACACGWSAVSHTTKCLCFWIWTWRAWWSRHICFHIFLVNPGLSQEVVEKSCHENLSWKVKVYENILLNFLFNKTWS